MPESIGKKSKRHDYQIRQTLSERIRVGSSGYPQMPGKNSS
jgi:hypothetical protein